MAEYLCPHCKNPIYDDEALSCLYCGESLERGIGFMGNMKYGAAWNTIGVIIALIVVASFILLMVL